MFMVQLIGIVTRLIKLSQGKWIVITLFRSKLFLNTISDDSYIISQLRFPSPRLPKINIFTRKIKSINIDDLQHDIELK